MYESYRSFASVYDEFMDGTDYQETADKIQDMITRYGVSKPSQKRTGASEARDVLLAAEKNLVVDLACGTGKLTEILADRGYDVMGIDLSEEMLGIALETSPRRCSASRLREGTNCVTGRSICVRTCGNSNSTGQREPS